MMRVSLDGAIRLRAPDGQRVGSFMAMPDVNACVISRDGRWSGFAAGHDDRVTIWDVTTHIKACEYNRSQDLLVSIGRCSALPLRVVFWLIICTVHRRTQAPYFTTLDISPDSSRTAIGDSTGSIVLLSIPTGEQLAVCSCDRGLYLDSLQFSPAGDYLAAGTAGKITGSHVTTSSTLHIWDVSSSDQPTRHLEVPFGSFDKKVAQDERPIIVNWLNSGQQVFVGSHRSLVVIDVLTKSTEHKDIPSFQTLSNDADSCCLQPLLGNRCWVHTFGIPRRSRNWASKCLVLSCLLSHLMTRSLQLSR